MGQGKITETALKEMVPGDELRDTEIRGFFARHLKAGKFFYFNYRSKATGKRRNMPIGRHGEITATKARTVARGMAGEVALGKDPAEDKRQAIQEAKKAKGSTLQAFMAGGYTDATPEKTAKPHRDRVKKHFPNLLDKPMDSISGFYIEKWRRAYPGKPAGANRILTSLRPYFPPPFVLACLIGTHWPM